MTLDTSSWSQFKHKLHNILLFNELGGEESLAYRLSHARTSESGYSYGYNQMDIANNQVAKNIFEDILDNAKDADGDLIISSETKTEIKKNWTTKGNASAISNTLKSKINKALRSSYGKTKIDKLCNEELDKLISHIDTIIASISDKDDKAYLTNDDAARLFLADYHNQYNLSTNGKMHKYLQEKL